MFISALDFSAKFVVVYSSFTDVTLAVLVANPLTFLLVAFIVVASATLLPDGPQNIGQSHEIVYSIVRLSRVVGGFGSVGFPEVGLSLNDGGMLRGFVFRIART